MAADWATISALATAGGTLVLAVATFGSVRSANKAARAAERSLLAGLRPVVMSSRMDDAEQKIHFMDGKWIRVGGSRGAAEVTDEAIYIVASLRNVGSGMAVLDSWRFAADPHTAQLSSVDSDGMRRLTRDIYIAPGEIGFWQGALRDPTEPDFTRARKSIEARDEFAIQILYRDHEGGQRVITHITFLPIPDGGYLCTTARHWNLDREDPR